MQTIGFIGASGRMGHGIARTLRAEGHKCVPSPFEAQAQPTGTRFVAR